MNAAEVVSVSIAVKDAAAGVPSFSTLALFASHTGSAGMQTIAASADGLAAMVDDGIATTDPAYRMASAVASASPGVDSFKLYRRSTVNDQSVKIGALAAGAQTITLEIVLPDGSTETVEETYAADATKATIATALAGIITAFTGLDAVVSATNYVVITPTTEGDRFAIRSYSRNLSLVDESADAGITTDLAAAVIADPGWYAFAIDSTCSAEIAAAAAWAEANGKLFVALSQDSAILDDASTTDIAATVKASGYNQTAVFFTRDGGGWGNVALIARQLSQDPGSSSWAFKALPGARVDALTDSEATKARAKNAIVYVSVMGLSMTQDGKAGSGRFLDITHGIAWLSATLQGDLVTLIANEERVPYTSTGIAQFESVIRARLGIAETAGLIAGGWTVTAPKLADVPMADRAQRILRNFRFNGTLQGAIHKVELSGTVSV